jgi:hypothetical protein
MSDKTCKMVGCDGERREGSKFCSEKCQVIYNKLEWEAKEAKRSEHKRPEVDTRDPPDYDGPRANTSVYG